MLSDTVTEPCSGALTSVEQTVSIKSPYRLSLLYVRIHYTIFNFLQALKFSAHVFFKFSSN